MRKQKEEKGTGKEELIMIKGAKELYRSALHFLSLHSLW